MDLSIPGSTTNSPLSTSLIPVFGDNVQDLLGVGALHVNPTGVIVVNSIADTVDDPSSGVTTLRDAINQANADDSEDLIVFERSLFSTAQTITLSGTELDITHNLDIIAPRDPLTGEDLVTVSGNNASRVFEIEGGATVTLSGLIVADGSVTGDDGGGIRNFGTLTLDSSIVRNNSATGTPTSINGSFLITNIGGKGGGIYNGGTSTVNNSTISGNSSSSGSGIYNGGTSTVNNSTISGNSASSSGIFPGVSGGGIYNGGTSTVSNSTISGNSASGDGGGIYNGGTSTVSNSTISGNTASGLGGGGGIYNSRTSTVSNSTISGNTASGLGGGGGIFNSSGNSTVSNSTISGNSASSGGGISNGGGIFNSSGNSTVSNSTISGNTASRNGGGISNGYSSILTLLFSTITQNQAANGGGVYQIDDLPPLPVPSFPLLKVVRGSFNARNTIIAANLNSYDGVNPDIGGTFKSFGYNLIGDGTGSTRFRATGDIVGTSDRPIDPRLAPLDFYGGPTQTLALLPDSPAIDAGDPTVLLSDPTTDQRGLPRVINGRADIGAFEVQV